MATTPNYATLAAFYIKGLTEGFIDPPEVISWADEVVVAEAKMEDWMLDISSSQPEDRMGVVHHLHAVKGEVDQAALAELVAARG